MFSIIIYAWATFGSGNAIAVTEVPNFQTYNQCVYVAEQLNKMHELGDQKAVCIRKG